jgi:hypothetical protein
MSTVTALDHNLNALHHQRVNTWCAYEVPGIILMCDLKGAMQFDHSKYIPTHFSTFIHYDFNA